MNTSFSQPDDFLTFFTKEELDILKKTDPVKKVLITNENEDIERFYNAEDELLRKVIKTNSVEVLERFLKNGLSPYRTLKHTVFNNNTRGGFNRHTYDWELVSFCLCTQSFDCFEALLARDPALINAFQGVCLFEIGRWCPEKIPYILDKGADPNIIYQFPGKLDFVQPAIHSSFNYLDDFSERFISLLKHNLKSETLFNINIYPKKTSIIQELIYYLCPLVGDSQLEMCAHLYPILEKFHTPYHIEVIKAELLKVKQIIYQENGLDALRPILEFEQRLTMYEEQQDFDIKVSQPIDNTVRVHKI